MNCPECLSPDITICHRYDESLEKLIVGAFWCQCCGHITKPIGREKHIPIPDKDVERCTR